MTTAGKKKSLLTQLNEGKDKTPKNGARGYGVLVRDEKDRSFAYYNEDWDVIVTSILRNIQQPQRVVIATMTVTYDNDRLSAIACDPFVSTTHQSVIDFLLDRERHLFAPDGSMIRECSNYALERSH